ncbi:50S ribosome-binding GTPase, partial [Mariniblastus sp.]
MTANNINSGLPVLASSPGPIPKIALLGNPNAGKTSLFNLLTGLRAKTANFPGTTVDYRFANVEFGEQNTKLIDLPGAYSLE